MKSFVVLLFYILLYAYEVKSACPREFIRLGESCYYFSEEKANWFEADSKCRDMGALLLSIETKGEEFYINLHLRNQQKISSYWTSGTIDPNSPKNHIWSVTGKRFSHANWCTDEPSNQQGKEDCINIKHGNGKSCINDENCLSNSYGIVGQTVIISYICEYHFSLKVKF